MKQTVEAAAREYSNDQRNRQHHCEPYCIVDFKSGVEWQKEKAIEALSSVLDNWVHGGDADCIIAELEEKLK